MLHRSSRPLRRFGVRAAFSAALAVLAISCSLLVEHKKQQCTDDSDCAGFSGAKCDVNAGVCVAKTTSTSIASSSSGMGGASSSSMSSSSATGAGGSCDVMGGIKGGGCFNCTPTNDSELLNHCTDGCIPFDKKRLTKLPADGKLPPLP